MKNENSIEILNSLITINNDRIEGYETASETTDEQDLKALFSGFRSTSVKCKEELLKEVRALNGEVEEGTKTSGKFFRAWMEVKAALTGKDRKAILNSCEFGEDKAKETYDKALDNDSEDLSPEHQALIRVQRSRLEADHARLESLLDALTEA